MTHQTLGYLHLRLQKVFAAPIVKHGFQLGSRFRVVRISGSIRWSPIPSRGTIGGRHLDVRGRRLNVSNVAMDRTGPRRPASCGSSGSIDPARGLPRIRRSAVA